MSVAEYREIRRITIFKWKDVVIRKKRICHGCDSWMDKGKTMMYVDAAINGNEYMRVYHCTCCTTYALEGPGSQMDLFQAEPGYAFTKEDYAQYALEYWTPQLVFIDDNKKFFPDSLYQLLGHLQHLRMNESIIPTPTNNPQRAQVFTAQHLWGLDSTTKQRGLFGATIQDLRISAREIFERRCSPSPWQSLYETNISGDHFNISPLAEPSLLGATLTTNATTTSTILTTPFSAEYQDAVGTATRRVGDTRDVRVDGRTGMTAFDRALEENMFQPTIEPDRRISVSEDLSITRREPLTIGDVFTEYGTERPIGRILSVEYDARAYFVTYEILMN